MSADLVDSRCQGRTPLVATNVRPTKKYGVQKLGTFLVNTNTTTSQLITNTHIVPIGTMMLSNFYV